MNTAITRAAWTGLLLVCACLAPMAARAYFQDLGMGVRPSGMGETFAAVADDSNSLFYNTAGLADVTWREINLMYSDLFSNLGGRLYDGTTDTLGYHNLGVVVPLARPIGTFGLAWTLFTSKFYREDTVILGYGREIGGDVFRWLRAEKAMAGYGLTAGMSLKIMRWQVTANDYTGPNSVFDGGLAQTGFTADIGLLLKTPYDVRVGMSLENFIPADVGLTIYETVPINFRLGTSYLYNWAGRIDYLDSILGALDFTQRNGISDLRAGVELAFFKNLFLLRLGSNIDQFTTGLSLNAPISGSPVDWRLDYAFGYPYGVQSTLGSHRVSLVVRWGGTPKAAPQSAPEPVVELPPEENLKAKRDAELAAERAREEARLQALMQQMREEVESARAELARIQELIKLGELPTIQFESGKAILSRESFASLDKIGEVLAKFPQIKVRLEGHTDSVGGEKANQRLSQSRVESVKEYLVGKFKLTPRNLLPVGYGESRPIASNTTASGRAANRRVEVVVLIPAGMELLKSGKSDGAGGTDDEIRSQIKPEDIVNYEDIEQLRERLNVYQMQMDPDEVEEMFNQQHQEDAE